MRYALVRVICAACGLFYRYLMHKKVIHFFFPKEKHILHRKSNLNFAIISNKHTWLFGSREGMIYCFVEFLFIFNGVPKRYQIYCYIFTRVEGCVGIFYFSSKDRILI